MFLIRTRIIVCPEIVFCVGRGEQRRQRLALDLDFQRLRARILRGGRRRQPQQRAVAANRQLLEHAARDAVADHQLRKVELVVNSTTVESGCCSLLWPTTTTTTKDPYTKPLELQVQGESLSIGESCLLATTAK